MYKFTKYFEWSTKLFKPKRVLLVFVVGLGLGVALIVFKPASVSAHPYNSVPCGYAGPPTAYAGLVVNLKWYDSSGGVHEAVGSSVGATVWTSGGTWSPPGNVLYLPPNHSEAGATRVNAQFFTQEYRSQCSYLGVNLLGDSVGVVLDYNNHWVLDCDTNTSKHPQWAQQFLVTPQGTPDGAWGGGSWDTAYVAPANGAAAFITLYYHEPPPPDYPPVGYQNYVNCDLFEGWAADPDNYNISIWVHVYVDGPAGGGGKWGGAQLANFPRTDVNNNAGIPGNHGYKIPTPSIVKDGLAHSIYIYAIGIDANGNPNGVNPLLSDSPKTIGPCGSDFTINSDPKAALNDRENPATVDFKINAKANPPPVLGVDIDATYYIDKYTGPNVSLGSKSFDNLDFTDKTTNPLLNTISLSGKVLDAGDQVCMTFTIDPQKGKVDGSGKPMDGTTTKYSSPPICDTVINKPYLRAYGNDIFTGVSAGCVGWPATTANNGGIYGMGRNSSDGSANQLALLAYGRIAGFSSAALRSLPPKPPTDLNFANSPPGTNGLLAGMVHCPNDYHGGATSANYEPGLVFPITSHWPGNYKMTDPGTKYVPWNGSTVPIGQRITLYVEGNVVINDDIRYSPGTWITPASNDIPSFTLVATGNIYIQQGVTHLDGTYIAQGPTSTIYTCATGTSRFDAKDIYNQCKNQLTVNGALIATRIKWLRTFGSLRNSKGANEWPNSPSGAVSCSNAGSPSTLGVCASEVINYNAQTYLAPQPPNTPNSQSSTYDYFTILPPLL